MPTHFTAFISYRHTEPDATVAGHIQRQLERYHIPKAIRKSTGIEKIGRIFRDKEELPLSTNLGDDIEEALHNSDFLIVICSPRLMESTWCQREIALFLEEHPIERVLTVLVEGEPGESVPEILRTGREPLSCDYRMPLRKAREIELPRLASAILGCRYDDLRQRERQYKARRRNLILSASLIAASLLSVYFFLTAREIQKNYEESLRNQSVFLASESLELLEDGDRLAAINLALEALPKGDERPWTAEAEFALGRAINAYGSTAEILATNAFTHGGTVSGYFTSPEGDILVSWDEHSKVYVWDTVTYALTNAFTIKSDLEFSSLLSLPDHRFLAGDFDGVYCYDYLTGELIWENTATTGSDLLLFPDQARILTGYNKDQPITILDAATGEALHTLSLPEEMLEGFPTINPLAISPTGNYLALSYSNTYGQEQLLTYDLRKDTTVCSDLIMNRFYDLIFTQDDLLIGVGRRESANYSSSMTSYGFSTLQKAKTDVFCMDPTTAEIKWENNFEFYLVLYHHSLTLLDYPMADGSTRPAVCATFANVCPIFDLATGELLLRLELPDSAVATETKPDYLSWILNNGSYCAHKLGGESVSALSYFPTGVIEGHSNGGFFVRTHNSNQILLFQAVKDDSWETFDQNVVMDYPNGVAALSEDFLVIKAAYKNVYTCYNMKDQTFAQTIEIDESSGHKVLGFTADGHTLAVIDPENTRLVLVDLATDTTEEITLPAEATDGFNHVSINEDACSLQGDRLLYVLESRSIETTGEGENILVNMGDTLSYDMVQLDLSTGKHQVLPLFTSGINDYFGLTFTPDAVGEQLLFTTKEYDSSYNTISKTQLLDLATGEGSILEDISHGSYGELPPLHFSPDGKYLAIVGTNGIQLRQTDGSVVCVIDTDKKTPLSLQFDPESKHLLVLYEDTSLYRYDLTGKVINWSEIYAYSTGLSSYTEISWQFTDKGLLVIADDICTLVDTESWSPYTYLRQYLHYNQATDRFFVSVGTTDGYVLCSYPRYTTQDLIKKAKTILGENTLSDEQKAKYGLE